MKTLMQTLLIFYCTNAFAISGNELYAQMNNAEKYGGLDYVQGLMDMHNLQKYFDNIDAIKHKRPENSANFICAPDGATYGQSYDLIKNYLAKHPEFRNQNAAGLAYAALSEVWDCP